MGSPINLLEAEDARILEEASPVSSIATLQYFWIAYQNFNAAALVHNYNQVLYDKISKKKK